MELKKESVKIKCFNVVLELKSFGLSGGRITRDTEKNSWDKEENQPCSNSTQIHVEAGLAILTRTILIGRIQVPSRLVARFLHI